MRYLIQAILFTLSVVAFAAVTNQQSLPVDSVVIGRPAPAADPQINFKGTTHKIKSNRTTNKLQFSNDGTSFKNLGSGSGGGSGVNLLQDDNFDFEVGTPFTGWTASGGTVTAETTNPLFDDKSLKWDSSASSQTLTSASKTIKAGMVGRSCQSEVYYKWASGVSGDLKLQVRDGSSNTLAELSLDPTVGDQTKRAMVHFDCPALAGTMTMRLISTVSNPAEITIDNAFLGSGSASMNIAQASLYAGVWYSSVAACDVSTTSGTVAEVANDADCTSRAAVGNASFVNNQFKMRVPSLPKGRYKLTTMVPVYSDASGTTCEVYIRATLGSMPAQYAGVGFITGLGSNPIGTTITVPWDQASEVGQTDFYMEWRRTAGAGACHMATASAGGVPFSMSLEKYPTTDLEAINLETSGWRVDANIGGSNPSLGSGALSTYSPIEDASLDLVNNSGNGAIAAQIPCSGTNPPTGLTCSSGNESVGVSFVVPSSGDVMACASFSQEASTGASGSITSIFQIVETPSNSQTILQEGKSRITSQNRQANTIVNQPLRVCGVFSFSSAGQKTLRLNYEQTTVATVSNNLILADRNTSNGQRDIHWEVYPLNQQMPAPVFTEIKRKVESNQQGEKIERARITNNGSTCATTHQSGNWISATRSGTGVCVLTFTGFTAAPACVVMSAGGAGDVANQSAITPTSTGMTITTFASTTGAASDKAFDIICMGPK